MDTPVIRKITEYTGTDGQGRSQPWVSVEFMVGTHGPFYERYPKVTFNAAQAQADINAFAARLEPMTRQP